VRATGGVDFTTAIDASGTTTAGCVIDSTGNLICTGGVQATAFIMTSDRALKTGFEPVAGNDVLKRVAALP
jgi:hypothetical protein